MKPAVTPAVQRRWRNSDNLLTQLIELLTLVSGAHNAATGCKVQARLLPLADDIQIADILERSWHAHDVASLGVASARRHVLLSCVSDARTRDSLRRCVFACARWHARRHGDMSTTMSRRAR